MRLFNSLYQKVLAAAEHRHAPFYLSILSFAEASFFPIPPDVMLAPMALAQPHNAWRNALLVTLASVLGGIFGYLLGWLFFDTIHSLLSHLGYALVYQRVVHWFTLWGFWIIFLAGFSPIPYKVFTIAAGATLMPLPAFILGSCVGRGVRFSLVTVLLLIGGQRFRWLRRLPVV